MADWKYQLGFIVPSWNTVMEYECWRMAPAGVSIHTSRLAHTGDNEEALLHMASMGPEGARLLADAKVNAICFGCTAASFVRPGIDQELIKKIEAATQTPATTTSTAIKEAFLHLGVKRVSIASPYDEKTNDLFADFLRSVGFEVVSQKGLNQCSPFLPPEYAYQVAKEVDREETEAIIISCTNFRSLEVIEKLEGELNKPVVSSNMAALWKVLRLAGFKDKITGGGKLLNS
jgi:maleate isomerase